MNIYRQAASRIAGGANIPKKEKEDPRRAAAVAAYHAENAYYDEIERKKTAELDKKYPRLAEPDEEGIDLALDDPRRRFIATCEGVTFYNPGPITEEEKAEVEALWEKMTGGQHSPEKKKKEAKKGRGKEEFKRHSLKK